MLTLRQLFLANNAQTTDFPLMLEFERAQGVYLYNAQGKAYLDLISGIGVSNIGHGNPEVIRAIKEQVDKYMHLMVYGEYVQTPQVKYAQKLASLLPSSLQSVYFTNSGSEAIEGAMKLAKRHTGRNQIIACRNSYHGSTQGALSIMGNEEFKQAYRPLLPGISFINFNNPAHLEQVTADVACVIIEPIQGEAGIRVPEPSYMLALRNKCNQTGTLLVFDENQTAFGRTGKLFAFEHFDGGMPLGAFVSSLEIMGTLKNKPILGHITTFGGHPVCCASGLAALEVLLSDDLISQVTIKEELFKTLLKHPAIKEVRGKGLMLAAELDSFEVNKRIIDRCIEQGIIIDWFLHCSNSMRIAPPLTITFDEIKTACDVIVEAIDTLT
jgi:acetylornithine/N-succinyldiaminopimelate aminotransferase